MSDNYKIIDADAHMLETLDMWDKYVEPPYKDRAPKVVGHWQRTLLDYGPGEVFPEGNYPTKRFEGTTFEVKGKYGHAYDSWWSIDSRLKDMDKEGYQIQVCFATNGLLPAMYPMKDPKLPAALARAYNNWCHDYCSPSSQRVQWAAILSLADVKEAVLELRRAVTDLGATTIMLRAEPIYVKVWHDPVLFPLWEEAERLDVSISFHTTGGSPLSHAGDRFLSGPKPLMALDHAAAFPMENMLAMGNFIFAGLLDKHPNLRLSFLEGNAGWVPFWLSRMDDHADGRQRDFMGSDTVDLKPSDYYRRQCFVAADADEGGLKFVIEATGDDNIIFNSDYPHPDAAFPGVLDEFLEQPIPEESKRKILWDNSLRLYGDRINK